MAFAQHRPRAGMFETFRRMVFVAITGACGREMTPFVRFESFLVLQNRQAGLMIDEHVAVRIAFAALIQPNIHPKELRIQGATAGA